EPLEACAMCFVKQAVRVVCEQQQLAPRALDLFQLGRLCARKIRAHNFAARKTGDELVECIALRQALREWIGRTAESVGEALQALFERDRIGERGGTRFGG